VIIIARRDAHDRVPAKESLAVWTEHLRGVIDSITSCVSLPLSQSEFLWVGLMGVAPRLLLDMRIDRITPELLTRLLAHLCG